ncbi:serine/threonine protein kinase [Spongiibacter sp. KMU-158]|uniref:Stress response kinase A n=1 Tax=Spongiibacter pelagi TaxID=2760804 RepID=A0A927BZM6_9GAMM|nr:serine/threonine protein kinase [Spongiibacter pelagi]MBD2857994.1 serine/threonine protein kinase [Spongiibacter pelagi]
MSTSNDTNALTATSGFTELNPDRVIDAVESQGLLSDLRVFALNSYENRVYQFGLEEAEPIVVKFYRPGRWSDAQILEEHQFTQELAEAEIPVIPPWQNPHGETLFFANGYRFAIYPRRGGHAPALDDMENLFQLGRLFGRLHLIGDRQPFAHRPTLNQADFGVRSRELILSGFIPDSLKDAYRTVSSSLLEAVDNAYGSQAVHLLRCHGDAHVGNILCRDEQTWLVDFDDSRMAPAMQDLWMFISGSRDQQQKAMLELIEGYEEFREFPTTELRLIEALRSLRLMHHAAWLAERWQDPAFPKAFPWFNTERFWGEHILSLREQLSVLQEPPLKLPSF